MCNEMLLQVNISPILFVLCSERQIYSSYFTYKHDLTVSFSHEPSTLPKATFTKLLTAPEALIQQPQNASSRLT